MAHDLVFSVSDSEVYDAYMSAPSHFNINRLLDEARQRSIFYSRREDAAAIARKLSRQVFGHKELQSIQEYFSLIGRADKTASVEIEAPLDQKELKQIVEELAESPDQTDKITSYLDGQELVVDTIYTEVDFGRNRLRQRVQREAKVRFEIGENSTTVTMPATQKGKDVLAAIRNRLEEKRKKQIETQEIELISVPEPEMRTKFFTSLASSFPYSTLHDVLRLKMQSSAPAPMEVDPDADEEEEELELDSGVTKNEEFVAGILRGVTLAGQELFNTSVFQQLRQRGFYVTGMTWRLRLQEPGNPIVEYVADFENAEDCTSFKYSANTWRTRGSTGEYNASFASTPPIKRLELVKALQRFAMLTANELAAQMAASMAKVERSGGANEPN
jgi:hypothetical protein